MKTLEDIERGEAHAFAIWTLRAHLGHWYIETRHENEGTTSKRKISVEHAQKILAHSNCPVCGGFLTTYEHESKVDVDKFYEEAKKKYGETLKRLSE